MRKQFAGMVGGLSLLVANASAQGPFPTEQLLDRYVPHIFSYQLQAWEIKEPGNIVNQVITSRQEDRFCIHLINRIMPAQSGQEYIVQYASSTCGFRPEDIFINGLQAPSIPDIRRRIYEREERITQLRHEYGANHVVAFLQEQQERDISGIFNRNAFENTFSSLKQMINQFEQGNQ